MENKKQYEIVVGEPKYESWPDKSILENYKSAIGRPLFNATKFDDLEKAREYAKTLTNNSSLWNYVVKGDNQQIQIGEKPCTNCTKMNDIGSAKCWWCELENPCR